MKIFFLFVILVILISACSPFSDANKSEQVSEYSKIVKDKEAIGLDVRSLGEYKQNGSELALNIPISQLSKRINELDKSKTILVFCESGGRSLLAKKLLQMKGFKKVINIKDWRTWNKVVKANI